MKPLTSLQKQRICELSKIVWDIKVSPDEKENLLNLFGNKTSAYSAWRHNEQRLACGKESLCECSDADFCAIMAHFYLRLENPAKANNWIMRAATDRRRKVIAIIRANCLSANISFPAYPEKICQSQFKCHLWHASEQQLFCVLSTTRNRIKGKKETTNVGKN